MFLEGIVMGEEGWSQVVYLAMVTCLLSQNTYQLTSQQSADQPMQQQQGVALARGPGAPRTLHQ